MRHLTSATPKARKRHECDLCSGTIEPGEVYDRASYIGESGPYTWKMCLPCVEVGSALVRADYYDIDWGYGPDDAWAWALDVAPGEPVAVAYIERREAAHERQRARRLASITTTTEDQP